MPCLRNAPSLLLWTRMPAYRDFDEQGASRLWCIGRLEDCVGLGSFAHLRARNFEARSGLTIHLPATPLPQSGKEDAG